MIYPINMSSAIIMSVLSAWEETYCIRYTQTSHLRSSASLHHPDSSLLAGSYHSQEYGGCTLGLGQILSPLLRQHAKYMFSIWLIFFVSVNLWNCKCAIVTTVCWNKLHVCKNVVTHPKHFIHASKRSYCINKLANGKKKCHCVMHSGQNV